MPSTIKLIAAGPPTTKIYTKGIISKIDEIDTGSFGNATYFISNDGTTTDQLEVYRGYGLGGARFKSADDIKVGDEVIVYGQVVYYNNKTMEFTQGSELYSLNGEIAEGGGGGGGGGTPAGTGSKEDPYNVAAAVAGSGNAWVKGYIVGNPDFQRKSDGTLYGNCNFDMADSKGGSDKLTVYRAKSFENNNFTEETTSLIKADDEVVLQGKLQKYKDKNGNITPELTSCYLISVNGQTSVGAIKADINANAPAYNVGGQRVNQGYKGLVIKGGKKLIQK